MIFYMYVQHFTGAIKRLTRAKMTTSNAQTSKTIYSNPGNYYAAKFKDEIYE